MIQNRSLRKRWIFWALGALLVASTVTVLAQDDSLTGKRNFRVRLTGPLSSDSSVGSKVAAQVVSPQEFAGDFLEGEVVDAHSSNLKDKESKLSFKFNLLYHKENKVEIQGKVTDAYNSKGIRNVDEQGFKLKADNSLGKVIGDVRRGIPGLPGRKTRRCRPVSSWPNSSSDIRPRPPKLHSIPEASSNWK
jgi:hypothetical protein